MWLVAMLVTLGGAADEALLQARAREAAGDDVGAVAVLDAAVKASPAWALGRVELGRLVLKSGSRPAMAEFHLDVARTLNPENPRAQYLYALAVEEQGRHADAMRALEVAITLREDYADAWFRLAGLRCSAENWKGAVAAYERYVALQPAETGARLQLAVAQERSGALKEAEATLRAVLTSSARVLATRRLADLLEREGRAAEAQRLRLTVDAPAPVRRKLGPSGR